MQAHIYMIIDVIIQHLDALIAPLGTITIALG